MHVTCRKIPSFPIGVLLQPYKMVTFEVYTLTVKLLQRRGIYDSGKKMWTGNLLYV